MGECLLGRYAGDWENLAASWTDSVQSCLMLTAALFLLFYTWNQAGVMAFRALGFKKDKVVRELGSCMSSILHCTVVCVLTYQELCSLGWGLFSQTAAFDLAGENTSTGIFTVIFCTSYMLADLVYLHLYSPEDTVYIIHHYSTVVYMSLCLFLGRGHLSVMLCVFLGEITNPLNNGMIISNLVITETGDYNHTAGWLNYFFACGLAVGFVFIRALYAPIGVCWLLFRFYLLGGAGAEAIPFLIRVTWVGLPLLVEYGSISFLTELVTDIRSGRTSKEAKLKAKVN